jgi:cyclopropane fatty-acyl-phospholipid synthase-like methyltransferase
MAEPIDCRILRRLESAESILDVGCSDGRLTTFLAYHTRRKVVGLDLSSRGFATAHGRAARDRVAELVE